MHTRVRTLILAIFFTSSLCLAAPDVQPASKPVAKAPALPAGVKVERDIQYVPDGDIAQRLDLYLPEKTSDKPLPLIVWIHGGGWRAGSKNGCPPAVWVP